MVSQGLLSRLYSPPCSLDDSNLQRSRRGLKQLAKRQSLRQTSPPHISHILLLSEDRFPPPTPAQVPHIVVPHTTGIPVLLPTALPRAKPRALSSRTATCSEIPSTQCLWHPFPLRELPAALAENTVEPNSTSDTLPASSPTLHSSCRPVSGALPGGGKELQLPGTSPQNSVDFMTRKCSCLQALRSCSSTSVLQAKASHVFTRRTTRCRK